MEYVANFELNNDNSLDALFEINAAGTTWGSIDGNMENQTDLKDALSTLNSQIDGNHSEITTINNILQTYGDIVTYDAANFATSAQGILADTALQPNDNITELNNNAGYIDLSALNGYATENWVQGQIGNGSLTIQRNGSAIGTFPANATQATTVNITVPTQASDIGALPDTTTIGNGATTILVNSTSVGTITANQTTSNTVSIHVPTTATEIGALPSDTTIEDLTTSAQQAALNSGATSVNISAIATNTSAITVINGKIPNDATTANQLTTEAFVNSSIATNTANFIGTFNSVAELEAYTGTLTNNDYAFVATTDSAGNTLYDRYKWNGTEWLFEYELNNSSFTAEQWAAINSGITTSAVSAIATNTSAIQNKQDILTPGTNITIVNNTISATTTSYTLPVATTNSLGGIKIGDNLSITSEGTLNASFSGTVTSVNNIQPDGAGNVSLTASDVGALPDTTVIPVVDQIYDATSTNAQSGVAIAEAIENNKENFIAEYGVTSFDDIVQAYTDGKTLYCKKIYNIISVYYGQLVVVFGNNPITSFVFDLVTSNYSRERIVVQLDAQDASITNWTSTDYNIPTKTSELTNNSGFITGINSSDVTGALGYTPVNPSSLATVATSGSYADLTNKPTIPTVNNATLTITQDGVSKGTFTANASSDVTIALDGSLPSQTGHAGNVLTTDGTDASWADTTTVYPVIETYINNGSWYRIYAPDSTGYRWCEMGGLHWNGSTLATTDNAISFLKNFKDTAYTFVALPLHQDANINSYSMYEKYTLRTVSSTVLRTVGAVFGYEWIAKGYIANEV